MTNQCEPGGENRPAADPAVDYLPAAYMALRKRVLDELASVQGRVLLASQLPPELAKEQLRTAHSAQRMTLLRESADFLVSREPVVLEHFADGAEVRPESIDPVIVPVRTPLDADLFRYATLQWSVPVSAGYGRRTRFLVRDRSNGKLIGIFALGDPVISQQARDAAIGWNIEQRNLRLYNVFDAFVVGAVEPYSQLLGGKLIALLMLSNETREFLFRKYAGNTTKISQLVKDATPVLITTTSALGRSSIYNRVTYNGTLMLHSVGFTRGYGHFHFPDELFAELRTFVREVVLDDPDAKIQATKYGSGPNWRFRVIRTALGALGIPKESLQHNLRREVFLAPVAHGWDAFLRGEQDSVEPFDLPTDKLAAYFRERWAIGRGARKPGYAYWRREEMRLTPLLPVSQLALGVPSGPHFGAVDLGAYRLSVGTRRVRIQGKSLTGVRTDGDAYISRLEGPSISMELAEICWSTGEREICGWDRGTSDPCFDNVIGRLRVGIYPTLIFRGMVTVDIRIVSPGKPGTLPNVRKTSVTTLSKTLGFDVEASLDGLSEATLGTRADLLSDTGPRRRDLCAIFRIDDHVMPAVIWALTRPIALAVQLDAKAPKPHAPTIRRIAPRRDDLEIDLVSPQAI